MIIGHDKIIGFLKETVTKNRVALSYVFMGPDAVGKKMTAYHFAALVSCTGADQRPCGVCSSCKKIAVMNSPDVHLVEPSGKGNVIGIEEIRDTQREAMMKPYESRYKVFIIDDADKMTNQAANSLLKTLEDSALNNIFIFVTSMPQFILPTIMSRSVEVKFNASSQKAAEELLKNSFSIPEEEANFLSVFSGGRIGMALHMKGKDMRAVKNKVIDKAGRIILNPDGRVDMSAWEYPERKDLKDDMSVFLTWFRDIFVYKVTGKDDIFYNFDRKEEIARAALKLSESSLENIIKKISMYTSYIDFNVNVKIIVDSFIADLLNMRSTARAR